MGEPAEFVCVRGEFFREGYRGVTAGSGGGMQQRGGVGSYDLKEPFL